MDTTALTQLTAALYLQVTTASPGRFALHGELDTQTAPLLADAVRIMVQRELPDVVEADLAGLTFLDAAGVRCLLQCHETIRRAGARLTVRRPSPMVVRIFCILDLTGRFTLDEPAEEAEPEVGHSGPLRAEPAEQLHARAAQVRRRAQEAREQSEAAIRRSLVIRR